MKGQLNFVPCVLNHAYVPRVLTCQRVVLAHAPCVLTHSRANVPRMIMWFAYLRGHMPTSFATIFSFAAIVAEVVHTVGKV